jgi:hypothetical protein
MAGVPALAQQPFEDARSSPGPRELLQPRAPVVSTSIVAARAASGVRGRLAVNLAAGDGNMQANVAAVAAGPAATAKASVRAEGSAPEAASVAIAGVGGGAFGDAAGMISLNQASGAGNAQANAVAISVGLKAQALADSQLAGTASSARTHRATASGSRVREASISEGAFRGARGLIQVNQAAGAGNRTANHFTVRAQP